MLKRKKVIPFDFILEELAELNPRVKPMFGCYGVYVEDQIMMILREKKDKTKRDDGVWLGTHVENHSELKKIFPKMRSIELFGTPPTAWQVLPVASADFENSVMKACEMIRQGDPRIGRTPKKKLKSKKARR
jgi:hypothetical protein